MKHFRARSAIASEGCDVKLSQLGTGTKDLAGALSCRMWRSSDRDDKRKIMRVWEELLISFHS